MYFLFKTSFKPRDHSHRFLYSMDTMATPKTTELSFIPSAIITYRSVMMNVTIRQDRLHRDIPWETENDDRIIASGEGI